MNTTQFRSCYDRLLSVDANAAERFRRAAREAHEMFVAGGEAQRRAWAEYRRYFPARAEQRAQEKERRELRR